MDDPIEAAAPTDTKLDGEKAGGLMAALWDAHDTLEGMSDSDIEHFEDDDEEREGAPVQYAARKVMEAIQMLEAQGNPDAQSVRDAAQPTIAAEEVREMVAMDDVKRIVDELDVFPSSRGGLVHKGHLYRAIRAIASTTTTKG